MPPDDARKHIVGADPVLASPWPLGEVAATALAACGRAAANLWELRTGEEQEVRVDVAAAAASLLGFALQSLDGETPQRTALGNPLVALYECRDGRWIHLHGAFPGLADRTRRVLGEGDDVAALVRRWDAQLLEDALAEAGTCGAMVRTPDEWAAHPQAGAIAPLGPVSITKIADSPPEPARADGGDRPLSGVRV